MERKPWSEAELELLRLNFADSRTDDLAQALGRPYTAVAQKASKLGLRKSEAYIASPLAHRLDGLKGMKTRFKPGTKSGRAAQLVVPVGSYRVNADGYLDQKISDQPGPQNLRWKSVHRLVWERTHGPVPHGHAVCFKPGRRSTDAAEITVDALELVTRRDLMLRNTYHRYGKDVAKLVQLRGALTRQINKRARQEDERDA